MTNDFDQGLVEKAWCPGCGNFGILQVLKNALQELGKRPEQVCLVSGIGQAAKTPQYLRANYFNGLHGRSLSPATAIKAANPELDVVVTSGDGCMYGEGGNHFIHTVRRNPNITILVHDNMVYGLTKGQGSPTTPKGRETTLQFEGVQAEPFNPLSVAIALDASFVARASIHDLKGTKEIIKKAVEHEGLSIVDIFQPCVTFNKVNTYQWLPENTYYLDESHDVHDRQAAFAKALETEKYPLGVFYISQGKTIFQGQRKTPLYKQELSLPALHALFQNKSTVHRGDVTVESIIQETPTTKTFICSRPEGFTFRAGQYAMLGFADKRTINKKNQIPLTIASSPHEEHLVFTIKKNTDFTTALLEDVNVGDKLFLSGPLGKAFCFENIPTRDVVMFSAGSGITPFRSMMRYALAKQLPHTFTMINANSSFEEIMYREELDQLSNENEHIFIMNSLDTCDEAWCGETGYISEEMIDKHVHFEVDNSYLLCGPPPMIKAVEEVLVKKGVHPSRIIKEDWEIPSANSKEE